MDSRLDRLAGGTFVGLGEIHQHERDAWASFLHCLGATREDIASMFAVSQDHARLLIRRGTAASRDYQGDGSDRHG